MKVSELIDYANVCWDANVLAQSFDEDTAAAILSVPLPHRWPTDSLFWYLNKNDICYVKNGYWLGLLGHDHETTNSYDAAMCKMWTTIWHIPGPPKLKHFLWRACKGSLATKYVLYQRYYADSPVCERSNDGSESIIHAFIDCSNTSAIWVHHAARSLLGDAPRSSFYEMFYWLYKRPTKEELLSICTTL